MIVYLQWAKETAEDWFALDVTSPRDVTTLPKKGVPDQNSRLDDEPGWLNQLNCQGLVFGGYDHVAVEVITPGRLLITGWVDDPDDWGDSRYALAWDLRDPAPDPRLGGMVNTVQQITAYATDDLRSTFPQGTRPWGEFVLPPAGLTLHGIWLSEENLRAHDEVRSLHGWREWIR